MRARNMLAASLAVLLLTMSSWASACDLSCALMALHSGCPTSATMSGTSPAAHQATQQGMQPAQDAMAAGMDMDHMAMPDDSAMNSTASDATAAAQLAGVAACSQSPCSRITLSVAPQRSVAHSPLPLAQTVTAAVSPLAVISQTSRTNPSNTSSPKLNPFDPLDTSLRI